MRSISSIRVASAGTCARAPSDTIWQPRARRRERRSCPLSTGDIDRNSRHPFRWPSCIFANSGRGAASADALDAQASSDDCSEAQGRVRPAFQRRSGGPDGSVVELFLMPSSPRGTRQPQEALRPGLVARLLASFALAAALLGFVALPRGRLEIDQPLTPRAQLDDGEPFVTAASSSDDPRGGAALRLSSGDTEEAADVASRTPSPVQTTAPERRDPRLLDGEHAAFPEAPAHAVSWAAMFACPAECARALVSTERLPESAGVHAANPPTGPPARRVAAV